MSSESLVSDLTFRIHHTMLPVADLDRAIDFYTGLLIKPLKASGPDSRRMTAWVRDPDGHAIELIQLGQAA